MLLADKVVVVCGGAVAIGRAVALACAREGARLAVTGLEAEHLATLREAVAAEGGHAEGWELDVRDPAAVQTVRDRVLHAYGRVDALINVAGIPGRMAPVQELEEEDWQEVLDVNLLGTFRMCRAFVPAMIERGAGGAIVNFSSNLGYSAAPRRSTYVASKWAVVGFTQVLALELGPHGIRANAVAPSSVDGERRQRWFEQAAQQRGTTAEAERAAMVGSIPLGEIPRAEHVADTCVYLVSERSRLITGELIRIHGGQALEHAGGQANAIMR